MPEYRDGFGGEFDLPAGVDSTMRRATPADTERALKHYTAMSDEAAHYDEATHIGVMVQYEDILLLQSGLLSLSSIDTHHLYERLERAKGVLDRRERHGF